jgi:hypothetical protein
MIIISRKRGLPFCSPVDTDARRERGGTSFRRSAGAVRSRKAHAEPSTAPDCLQRPLVPRVRFRQQVSASVRRQPLRYWFSDHAYSSARSAVIRRTSHGEFA